MTQREVHATTVEISSGDDQFAGPAGQTSVPDVDHFANASGACRYEDHAIPENGFC